MRRYSSHLHCPHIVPLRFLPNLLLHVVVALCHFGSHTGGPIATEVSSRVILVDLWTSFVIIRYHNHAWVEEGREKGRDGEGGGMGRGRWEDGEREGEGEGEGEGEREGGRKLRERNRN